MATYFGAVSFRIRPSVLRTTVTLRRDPNHTRARLLSSIALHLHHPAQTAVTALRVNDVPLPIPRDDNVILVPSRLMSCMSEWNTEKLGPYRTRSTAELDRLCNHITIC